MAINLDITRVWGEERIKMAKIYKIGRYYYREIPCDEHGEPKILRDTEDEGVFTLVDCDGEPIKFFKRISKSEIREL